MREADRGDCGKMAASLAVRLHERSSVSIDIYGKQGTGYSSSFFMIIHYEMLKRRCKKWWRAEPETLSHLPGKYPAITGKIDTDLVVGTSVNEQ